MQSRTFGIGEAPEQAWIGREWRKKAVERAEAQGKEKLEQAFRHWKSTGAGLAVEE